MGKLQVTICGARNLHDSQVVSLPDPYCRVRLGDKRYKTKVIEDNLDPVWDETFRFQVADESTSQVHVELWNKNVISDDVMGVYTVSLSGMTKGVVQDNWYLLAHSKTNAELHLRMLACDFGNEPQASDRWKITTDIDKDPVLKAGQKAPEGAAPNTVSSNNNNTPILPNKGPAVVPTAAMEPQMPYSQPMQPAYQQHPQPPQGYYPPPQHPQPPQGYYPPPQHPQPQGYYPPPQQPQPPQGYYPPPQQPQPPQGYYPPPPPQQQQQYYGQPQNMSPANPSYRY